MTVLILPDAEEEIGRKGFLKIEGEVLQAREQIKFKCIQRIYQLTTKTNEH